MVSRQPHLPLSLAAKQLLCIVKQFTLPIDPFLHREDVVFDATISRWWKTVSYRLLGQNAYIWDIYTILKEVDLECLLFLPDASCGCVCWYSNSSQTIFTSKGCEMHFNKWYRAYHTNMSRLSNNHNIEIINRCYATSRPSTTAGLFGWCSRRASSTFNYLIKCCLVVQLVLLRPPRHPGPVFIPPHAATILSHPRRHHVQLRLLVAFPRASIPKLVYQQNSRKKKKNTKHLKYSSSCCRSCCSTRQTSMSRLYRSFDRQSPMIFCSCIACRSATEC